jgi:hypothetical protein
MGYLIPPPPDPVERERWLAGVAARVRAGLGVHVGDDYLTDGPPAPKGEVWRFLDRGAIGALFGVSADAVRKWQERYADGVKYRPFPTPDAILGGSPGWAPAREPELWAWHRDMPGQGRGGGRPRKQAQSE